MQEFNGKSFTGERALFKTDGAVIRNCSFFDGESPLKESRNLSVYDSSFGWKYPLWYGNGFKLRNCRLQPGARAGIWYTANIEVRSSEINAPKNFRRSSCITLENVCFTDAGETMWACSDVSLSDVSVKNGDYFAMNCQNVTAVSLDLEGNYSFDGAKNVIIKNSRIISKDAFWNSENVTVYDSYISGEYLGWNAKNLTLIGCTIESLQGLCYVGNLTLRNCVLENTTLAFEYSAVDAEIIGGEGSIKNPSSGIIKADGNFEIIMEEDKVDVNRTNIIVGGKKVEFCQRPR